MNSYFHSISSKILFYHIYLNWSQILCYGNKITGFFQTISLDIKEIYPEYSNIFMKYINNQETSLFREKHVF